MVEIETPALVVDRPRMFANLDRIQSKLTALGIRNRPHVKTHRSTNVAKLQLQAGAVGITCQKLQEAQVMVDAGIENVLIPYNIIGAAKHERLRDLLGRARVAVSVDDSRLLEGLAAVSRSAESELDVFVECDTGFGRTGVTTPESAGELAVAIERHKLRFAGLLAYPAPPGSGDFMQRAVAEIEDRGLSCESVSLGGTVDLMHVADLGTVITEFRPGAYVYNDWNTVLANAASVEDCALTVVTTVVSTPRPGRVVLDAGSKALAADVATDGGHGHILEAPNSSIGRLSEEHAEVTLSGGDHLELGEVVHVVPAHVCVVSNLFGAVWVVDDGVPIDRWPIEARGCSL
jgi:D-serine deaminase-like pyridoxal phosphate-dependent protein